MVKLSPSATDFGAHPQTARKARLAGSASPGRERVHLKGKPLSLLELKKRRGGGRAVDLGSRSRDRQYASDETTSLPRTVMILRRIVTSMVSLRNFTEPSPKRALTPPGWKEKGSWLAPACCVLPQSGSFG